MREFARSMGLLSVVAGALLLAFPETAKGVMRAREEFSQLSPGALRLLGGWELLMGVLLVSSTATPAVRLRLREVPSTELRKAA